MAGGEAAGGDLAQERADLRALLLRHEAAGVETAAGQWGDRGNTVIFTSNLNID